MTSPSAWSRSLALTLALALVATGALAACGEDAEVPIAAGLAHEAEVQASLLAASAASEAAASTAASSPGPSSAASDPTELQRAEPSASSSAAPGRSAPIEVPLYNNENGDGVTPGAKTPSTFTVGAGAVHLSSLTTYHYMLPNGLTSTGQVGLVGPDGATYGPWPTIGSIGQGGIPNAMWRAVTDVTLPTGTYTITDSDPSTWSANAGTGGAGMFWTTGYRMP